MKKSNLSRFVAYYTSYYSEHVHSLGSVNTIFLGLCSINHLCVQTHQICTPILTVQHSHHTDYHNLIFSRYDKFSTLFHLIYHYAHINKVNMVLHVWTILTSVWSGLTCFSCVAHWEILSITKLYMLSNHGRTFTFLFAESNLTKRSIWFLNLKILCKEW